MWLGHFGERIFQALCAAAACTCAEPKLDAARTDFYVNNRASEVIRVQVKTTENPNVAEDGFRYPLDVATYNRLRQGATPGYLALVVMSAEHPDWTRYFPRNSLVRGAVRWARLAGLPATDNQHTVTVAVPFEHIMTPGVLLTLFPEE